MVLYCQKCGSQLLAEDSIFCNRCGARVSVSDSSKQNSAQKKPPLTLDQAIDWFHDLILAAFDDVDKVDEITIIKYFIKLADNDLKQTEGFSRSLRTNRVSILKGGFNELGFDISDRTIEYLYDSIISDMYLKKIPNHSISQNEFKISVNKDESGVIFSEFVCPACDEKIRFETPEHSLNTSQQWKLICPHCSYKSEISRSALIPK